MSTQNLTRMSHTDDPGTSRDAAEKAVRGRKVALIQGAILGALKGNPGTPREVLDRYNVAREETGDWLPEADLYDIRRRMTELEHDHKRIAPIPFGFSVLRRNGERVMRVTEGTN